MDQVSIDLLPAGKRASFVVSLHGTEDSDHFGTVFPCGGWVTFKHVGCLDGRISLYDVKKSGVQVNGAWQVELNPKYPPLGLRNPEMVDLCYNHDVLCGLGGFSTATSCLSIHTVTAVDWTPLALKAFGLNHSAHALCADISCVDTVYSMHLKQLEIGRQPMLTAGVPCQGHQKGPDVRSLTLPAVLRAAVLLGSAGLVLECVPEAQSDPCTQRALREFAEVCHCDLNQKVLHLHAIWPARRSRWFATLTPKSLGFCGFPDLPTVQPAPVLGEIFPFDPWPIWDASTEAQLRWTQIEEQAYSNPAFGNTNRRLSMSEPCPTALHSWGAALFPCPCGCRLQGFSVSMLKQKGLRGIEVKSGAWPYCSRHIHPKELQLILGFPPFEAVLEDCRAQLVLFGNAVSPIHGLWIFSHLLGHIGFLAPDMSPRKLLADYLTMLLRQRDLTWPSPLPGVANLQVVFQGISTDVTFHTMQTVRDLIRAETMLLDACQVQVSCMGVQLPPWAFLQERQYQIDLPPQQRTERVQPVPVIVEYLGVRHFSLVPASLNFHAVLKWLDIHEYQKLVDSDGQEIDPTQNVQPWRSVIVQQAPELVDFELALRLTGRGPEPPQSSGLQFSGSWCSTGLWHLDQLVRSDLLVTWTGLGFPHLTCWLPSFAEAVVELWPCTIDEHLKTWLRVPIAEIFAMTWETWGWNLVKFELSPHQLCVVFFEVENAESSVVSLLTSRVKSVAGRPWFKVQYQSQHPNASRGSLISVLELLEASLGLPATLVAALRQARENRLAVTALWTSQSDGISPTLPFSLGDTQLPVVGHFQLATAQRHLGLSARFILDFARALLQCASSTSVAEQVKVVCKGSVLDFPDCQVCTFFPAGSPIWIFFLVNSHWTLVKCQQEGDSLAVLQFDGLAWTSLSELAPLVATLKKAWHVQSVHIRSVWDFPQQRSDSCGTIALAHFAYQIGVITYEQAVNFESLHDSLAICSSLCAPGPCGFGSDEAAVVSTLEQILPSKGVPPDEVPHRAAAAIKVFGIKAVQKALNSSNQWAALKTLGNSKPKPFLWVTHQELQAHIQERSQSKFGVDIKKPKSKLPRKEPAKPMQLDPSSLLLPPGVFTTNCGTPLQQLTIDEVQRDARGIAFASVQEAQPFLSDGK